MAGVDFEFNNVKGKGRYYAELPAANDALILVLLQATGLEADDVLNNYDDLAALLAAANDEATFTGYTRVQLSGVVVSVDDTNNRASVDANDVTFAAQARGTNNTVGKALICYDGDIGAGTDANIIPLWAFDVDFTTDDNEIVVRVHVDGLVRWT